MAKIISQINRSISRTLSVEDGGMRTQIMALHCSIDSASAGMRVETFDDALRRAHEAELQPLIDDFREQAQALADQMGVLLL